MFGVSLLLLAIRRLRQYRLKERYTLLFFLISAPLFALSLWPDGVAYLAHKLHIEYGTVALLGVTALFSILILELLSIVSVQDRKINTLAQLVGILMERHEQAGLSQDPTLPTEDELRTMLGDARRADRARSPFKPAKPLMMSVTEKSQESRPS